MSRKDLSEQNKEFFAVCVVYDYTEYELDKMNVITKVYPMVKKVNKIFKNQITDKSYSKIGGYRLNYEPGTYTLGKFVSLSFYMSQGWIKYAHNILASLTGDEDTAAERANYYLTVPMDKIVGSLKYFLEKFKAFIREYKNLFGLDREDAGEIESDPFSKRWGWIYSATKVADHNRITLDAAMGLPVRQAFNDLAYLKAKDKFDAEQIKKK